MDEGKWYYKIWEPFYEQANLGENKTEARPRDFSRDTIASET